MMDQSGVAQAQKGDLEVMGVSRSGRVRKKSSKLMDFQSPDEIETRSKKVTPVKHPVATVKGLQQHNQQMNTLSTSPSLPSPTYGGGGIIVGHPHANTMKSDDDQMDFQDEQEESEELESDDDDMEEGVGETEETSENFIDPTVRQSIYMSEKSNKKKVMKDGKMVYGKAQRKDKGKTRFTAYMLWARDARKQMLSQQPDLDFGSISRRLGEMWANVPMNEKLNWKRRLKRYISKPKNADKKDSTNTSSKFLNKGQHTGNNILTNSNTSNKLLSGGQGNVGIESHHHSNSRTKKHSQSETSTMNDLATDSPNQHVPNQKKSNNIANKTSPTQIGAYKVTGIEPVDVAAHLKLLGDSLTIIGERLKEHEGQITVSGSLSVLLDSLLCSLGPLMCLTTQIPGFSEKNQHIRDTLHNTLDNIAYVMPGL